MISWVLFMRQSHYQNKSLGYGIGHTRLRKILELAGNISGKRVLDIGCATGYLGRHLKEAGNEVIGVEISAPAAEEARKILDQVHIFDIEYSWPEVLQGGRFDLAIAAETLEHVFDPLEVLKEIRQILAPNGEIIITTPNFLTWTNRIKFLLGKFKYTNQGSFDFGHIRFFTYAYLQEVLSASDFKIVKENHIIFPGKLSRILRFWPNFFASQFVIKARKT